MIIRPAKRLRGVLKIPGDKSISHRAAIISSLASGQSTLNNFSTSEDCSSTLDCLRRLGVPVRRDQNRVWIKGAGLRGLSRPPAGVLDCGNSGTTMRLLAGVLAGQGFESELTGDKALRSRPMSRIVEPLERMGARISTHEGHAPLMIQATGHLSPVLYEMPVPSAQVKSCLLLAALYAEGRTTVIEKVAPTRDHTERMFAWFGLPLETEFNDGHPDYSKTMFVNGQTVPSARDIDIPGDISSATFFIAASSFIAGSSLELLEVGLNPTRNRILEILQGFGSDIRISGERTVCNEPVGNLRITGNRTVPGENSPQVLRGSLIPELIDELPMLAVVGTQIQGGLTIRDAAELRFKETDRISATVINLRSMGASVEEFDDGLAVSGPVKLKGAVLDSMGDHRIAMAFAVAALLADSESEIVDSECVRISLPEFFPFLESIVQR